MVSLVHSILAISNRPIATQADNNGTTVVIVGQDSQEKLLTLLNSPTKRDPTLLLGLLHVCGSVI
jgi:hypothetical protein